MEGAPTPSKLPIFEQALYKKFAEKNPGMTEDDFIEFRNEILAKHSTAPHTMTEANGIFMEGKPTPEEASELNKEM